MNSKLTTITLTGCDFEVVATREGMESLNLEIKTIYDDYLEADVLAGYYILRGSDTYYCEGTFPLASKTVEIVN